MAKVLVTDTNLTNIANAIRTKNSSTTTYTPAAMASAILAISPTLQSKTVTPTTTAQTITADNGYDGLQTVTVSRIPIQFIVPTGTVTITANGTYNVTDYSSASVNVTAPSPSFQSKTITPSTSTITVTADNGYDGLSSVVVRPMPTGSLATPSISVTNGVIVATSRISSAGYLDTNTIASSSYEMTTSAGGTFTPTTVTQTIARNTYLTGTVTIPGDTDLIPANIASGINIFGVTGTLSFVNYFTGTATPSNSIGNNGDLYFQVTGE